MIAQVQIEANSRPSITSLTTQFACMNRPQRVTSAAGAANATFSIDLPSSNPNARPHDRAVSQIRYPASENRHSNLAQLFNVKPYLPDERPTLRTATAIPDFNFKSIRRLLRLILVKGRRCAVSQPLYRFRQGD